MGRKMGINTKAVEARERKEAQKNAKKDAVARQKEDEYWRDDDKHVNRKLNRQKEREQKLQEERDRKLANKAAYEREMEIAESSSKASKKASYEVVPKVTRAEITKNLEEEEKNQLIGKMKNVSLEPTPLIPNMNRLDDGENASSIDQALDLFRKTPGLSSAVAAPPMGDFVTKKAQR